MSFFRLFSLIRPIFILPLFLLFSCGGDDATSSAGAAPSPSLTITWPAFPDTGVFESSSGFLRDPIIDPVPDSFKITKKSGGCQWNDEIKVILFFGLGDCTLTVTANKEGFPEKMRDFSVTVAPGVISATAGSYGEGIYLGDPAIPSPLTGLSESDADASYVSADEDICTVDEDTGAVTGVDEGECRVTLTLSKAGYTDNVIEYVTPVTILPLNDFKGRNLFNGLFVGNGVNPGFCRCRWRQ